MCGNLSVRNIRLRDGSAVTIKEFLGVGFCSLGVINLSSFRYNTKPYVEISAKIFSLLDSYNAAA